MIEIKKLEVEIFRFEKLSQNVTVNSRILIFFTQSGGF